MVSHCVLNNSSFFFFFLHTATSWKHLSWFNSSQCNVFFSLIFFNGYSIEVDKGRIHMTLVLNEACPGFLKNQTRSLSDVSSLGIVTLCGVRFHVREISLTQRHLSSICKAS